MEDQLVIISAYTNPHQFYILFEKDREKLIELEKSLLKHKDAFKEISIIPNDYITVNDKGKWKRALVQSYKREISKYECWLIDYGQVLITDQIYELPKCFLSQPFIQPACLYNTVPLKSSFNIKLAKPVHEKQLNFCLGTIKVAGDYIKKAKSITFRLHNVINGVFCGSLHLQYEEYTVDLIEELVKTNHVILDSDLFLQIVKDSFPTMHSGVNIVLPRSESLGSSEDCSLGRGYQRHKSDKLLPRTSRMASVTNCLVQNKIKVGGTSRRPTSSSAIFSINERSSVGKHSSSTSSEKSETKTNADINNLRLNAISPVNTSTKEIVNCLNNSENISNIGNLESRLTQDALDKCSPNKSLNGNNGQGDRELVSSPQSSRSSGSDVGNVSLGTFDLKTLIKGRGKSKATVSPANKELNKSDLAKTCNSAQAESNDLNSETSSINGDNNFKCVLAKIKQLAHSSPKGEDDKWEDVEESDTYSQDTTDCSLNKSSFEDSSDSLPIKTKSPRSRPHSGTSNYQKIPTTKTDSKKSSSSLTNSGSDSDVSLLVPIRTKLQIGCQCEECRKWDADDIAEKKPNFAERKRTVKKVMCKPPPLFKNASSSTDNVVMKKVESNRSKIEKDIAPCLLVHSVHIPSFASGVVDVAFCTAIHNALNCLKIKTAYTIQTYAWPAIMRLMNTCLVGASNTGKTMAYLPAMCSFVIEKTSRFTDLPNENSPIVIVLCESLHKVEETYNLFITVLKQTRERVKITFVIPPMEKPDLKSIKSSDILIATPKILHYLLSSRIINLKRLCHLVVEDADKILSKHGHDFDNITKGAQGMLDHRACFYGVQVITVSETWTPKLEVFVKKLDNQPIICISNYLQCAIYARAKIQMHFVKIPTAKLTICSMVKEKSGAFKTVIVCHDDTEVLDIGKLLQVEGASVSMVTSNMMTEEISEEEHLWNSTVPGRHSVLICTDVSLNTQLSITQAEILIHYSLPEEHWSAFSRRFKCLLDNYECPLNSKFQAGRSCEIHVFVNDNCSRQYPRLVDFLTKMGTPMSEKFVNLSKSIKESEEQIKIQNNTPLCKILKLLGHCDVFGCRKRHTLSETLDLPDWMPTSGRVKFKLLSVQDATVFGVRLLEHTDPTGRVEKITDCTTFLTDGLKNDVSNKSYPINIKAGELYVWYNENVYHRCKVLKILHEQRITKRAAEVLIRLIDGGRDKRVLAGNLFDLPDQYRNVPPQSIDVYLANILPLDGDEHWSARAKTKILNILKGVDDSKENSYFAGRIVLQIGDCLWLDDIQFYKDLEYTRETASLLALKMKMLNMKMCTHSEQQLNELYKHCNDCGINLPNYIMDAPTNSKKRRSQVKPQWAFLEEGYNVVLFAAADTPQKFYVRLQKFNKIFLQLQRHIQEMIKVPFYPEVEEVIVGNCYLAQDPEGEEYGRVIVRGINDDMVECFFVDFGDSVTASKSELKFLNDDTITQLPYQAIECSLYGVQPILDNWAYETTDVFYNNDLDSDVKYLKLEKSSDEGRNIYSVVMFDYSTEKTMFINKLLIDCGYALEVEDEDLRSVSFPEVKQKDENESDLNIDDEEILTQPVKKDGDESSSDIEDGDDTWHVCVNDIYAFLKDSIKQNNEGDDAAIRNSSTTNSSDGLKPIQAAPSVGYCTPDVTWYQTNELIKMDILISNVEDYSIHILRKNIFSFSTLKNDKQYKLNFQLFKNVSPTFQHSGGGLVVRITLTKETPAEWDRLTLPEKKMRNIKYDMSKFVFPDEEKKRVFLDLGKDNPDEVDNDEIVLDIGSDVDYSDSDVNTDFESD